MNDFRRKAPELEEPLTFAKKALQPVLDLRTHIPKAHGVPDTGHSQGPISPLVILFRHVETLATAIDRRLYPAAGHNSPASRLGGIRSQGEGVAPSVDEILAPELRKLHRQVPGLWARLKTAHDAVVVLQKALVPYASHGGGGMAVSPVPDPDMREEASLVHNAHEALQDALDILNREGLT